MSTTDTGSGTQADIRATVKYIADPGVSRLVYTPSEAGKDNSVWAGDYEDHEVAIRDARPLDATVDREGFALVANPTRVADFYDDRQIRDIWEPEVEALLKAATGAKRVLIFDHTRRADARDVRETRVVREPAGTVHNDYTDTSGPRRLRDLLPEAEAEALMQGRFAIVNVWRSASGTPVETSPLALCDARSVDPADLIVVERRAKERIGEVQQVRHNPDHRWYWYPRLQPDEAILLKTFDSARDGTARFMVHTAFADPTAPASARPRESIETRAFLFF